MMRQTFPQKSLAALMLLLAAVSFYARSQPAALDWAGAQLVTLEMVDDRFVPDKFVFRRGVPYRLHMENTGADIHEFTAPEFLKAIAIRNPEILEPTQRGEVVLQPKEQKDLYFVALQPGRYRLTCANHDWDNMIGSITVE